MQNKQKIRIKGMVCQRCISLLQQQIQNSGLPKADVQLGEITFSEALSEGQTAALQEHLHFMGLSLLQDKNSSLVLSVKALVREVYSGSFDFPYQFRFSVLAAEKLHTDYDAISRIFSASENTTLEQYIIQYRIEKIKELLVYTNDTLSDISFKLGFTSVAHLSRQFKQQTGLNPSWFRLSLAGRVRTAA